MKLKKIAKHISFDTEITLIEFIDNKENILYKGNIIPLHAATSSELELEDFLEDCKRCEDEESIKEVLQVGKYINYKLDTDISGEAMHCGSYVNEHGVRIPTLTIYIRK